MELLYYEYEEMSSEIWGWEGKFLKISGEIYKGEVIEPYSTKSYSTYNYPYSYSSPYYPYYYYPYPYPYSFYYSYYYYYYYYYYLYYHSYYRYPYSPDSYSQTLDSLYIAGSLMYYMANTIFTKNYVTFVVFWFLYII